MRNLFTALGLLASLAAEVFCIWFLYAVTLRDYHYWMDVFYLFTCLGGVYFGVEGVVRLPAMRTVGYVAAAAGFVQFLLYLAGFVMGTM